MRELPAAPAFCQAFTQVRNMACSRFACAALKIRLIPALQKYFSAQRKGKVFAECVRTVKIYYRTRCIKMVSSDIFFSLLDHLTFCPG